jgi:branched-subunit amino acid transport protein
MDLNIIILAIIVTSVATFISRFSGALTSEKVKAKSKTFEWFNCVAYSTLAALVARMIIFPAGVLAESDLIIRLVVVVICVVIFILSKKNLVIPTIFSAIFLSLLTNL